MGIGNDCRLIAYHEGAHFVYCWQMMRAIALLFLRNGAAHGLNEVPRLR